MTSEEARTAARRAFGRVEQTKEQQRGARSFIWLEDLKRDIGYALRTLTRTPGFTATAVLTLALGIGAVTIIYSIINNVLFDPLPYPHSDRLVNVFVENLETGFVRGTFPADEFVDYRDNTTVFEDVVGTMGTGLMYAGSERSEILRGVWVTPNFFDFMGLPAQIGRTANAGDARPGRISVEISHASGECHRVHRGPIQHSALHHAGGRPDASPDRVLQRGEDAARTETGFRA
jgi:hypothetical protein